jgi:regulator of cell morphogenesis and NO signaling
MKLTPTTTLAEIASKHPSLLRELEHLGLDYCCGGQRSLDEACRQQGLEADAVVVALGHHAVSEEKPSAWLALSPEALVDHLEATHHRYLKQELPRLDKLAARVSRVHGANHPELVKVAAVVSEIRADLEPHLRMEEEVLFPMIRLLGSATSQPNLTCGSIRNPIAMMESEHQVVGGIARQTARTHPWLSDTNGHLCVHAGTDGGIDAFRGRHPPARAQREQSPVPGSHRTGSATEGVRVSASCFERHGVEGPISTATRRDRIDPPAWGHPFSRRASQPLLPA